MRLLYIGPLKALINDQFRRLEDLCAHAEIPVHRWHGDVSATDKQRLRQSPGGVLLITPGDREDILLAAGTMTFPGSPDNMAGIVLTGGLTPGASVLKALQALPIPVLLAQADSYQVASKVNNLTVKTRPTDGEKISLIRDIVAKNVNLKKILQAL